MERSSRIWEEVLRAVSNGQQPSDAQWQGLTPDEQEMINTLRRQSLAPDAIQFLNQINEEQAWSRLSKTLHRQAPIRSMRIRTLRYAAVFIGALVLGAGAFFILRKSETAQPVVAGNYITPPANHKRAVLTLDDGRDIQLDKADSKIQQGRAEILNVDTALLRYTTSTNSSTRPSGFNTLATPRGGEYKVQLSDGTEVWLNAETKLRYPAHFAGLAKREVFLENGEAYFKVAAHTSQPFIVHAKDMSVQVLGTEFNINTYTKAFATTLVNGAVRLDAAAGSTQLKPDQQATFAGGNFKTTNVDVEPYVAWIHGQLVFVETPLEEVINNLGRQYDLDVEFTSPELKTKKFGGRLRRAQHIEDVLSVIGKVANARFSIRGKTIVVDPDQPK